MNKQMVLSTLEELGFMTEEVGTSGYYFKFEDLGILYMPDDDDDFLRFAVPNIFEVTEENKPFVLDVINAVNLAIKYSKTCVNDDEVWIYYEYRVFGEEHLEEIVEHCMLLLQVTYALFYRKVEGDDTLPYADEDNDDNDLEEEG